MAWVDLSRFVSKSYVEARLAATCQSGDSRLPPRAGASELAAKLAARRPPR